MGDIEKAKRELRFAKSTADDKRWDQLEPKLASIEAALQGVPDAEKAPVAAEAAALRAAMNQGLREEKAGRIEREIKRGLSAAADDLQRGYDESPQLPKAIARLDSAEAKECLSPAQVAALQAEIAALQGKSKKAAPPPPPKPAAAAPSPELEKARRELRYAKSTADDKRWDQLEPRLQAVEAALKSAPDAGIAAEVAALRETMSKALREEKAAAAEREIRRSLSAAADDLGRGYDESPQLPKAAAKLAEAKDVLAPATAAALQAEIDALRATSGKKAAPASSKPASAAAPADPEKAGRIEREIKRSLSAAADDLQRGYDESPQLPKAIARLESAEAQEALPASVVAALQAEIAALQAKSKKPAAAAPPPKPAAAAPAASAPAAKPAAAAPVENERARALEGDLARTLRFGLDEAERNPLQAGSYVAKLNAKLESDEAKQSLSPEKRKQLQSQVDELDAKIAAAVKADRRQTLEGFIDRYLRNAEDDAARNRRQAESLLRNAAERIQKDDAKELLSKEKIAHVKAEVARIEGLVAAAAKKEGLDRATPILEELEARVKKPIFDDSQPAWRALGDLEALKSRVRGALFEVPKDDADVKKIEARIAKADDRITDATAKLDRDSAHERVKQAWELEEKAIEGWDEEKAEGAAYDLPKTALAVRRLTWFVNDKELAKIGEAHKGDQPIQALLAGAKKLREDALKKLQAAFDAAAAKLEKGKRPSNRIDLEEPFRLAGRAGSDFEGAPARDKNVARAKGVGERWEKEIEADRKARQKKYDELSAEAAKAWPKIRAGIEAEKEFDPQYSGAKGKAVLIEGLRNRIGWDFGGPYHFAIWVEGFPVIGNYSKTVLAAVEAACEKTGLGLDDHTDWDAVIVVGGRGKIKLRTEIIIRDRGNLEIGKVEEWRPVDAVTCEVVALRAGPVAVGPKA